MRVLMLSTNFHPIIGGAESYCRDLAIGLARRGHDVTVFTGPVAGAPARAVERGVTVLRARSGRDRDVSAWEDGVFGLLPALERSIRLQDLDVVHANSQDATVLGAILSLQHQMPLVVTSHEVGREHGPLGLGRGRLVFSQLPVAAYIAVSDYYQQVAHSLGARQVHRIDLGVDLDRFRPGDAVAARRRWGVGRDDFVVGCIARFKPRKGLLELLDAMAQVRTLLPGLRLLLAGTASSASRQYAAQVRARITTLELSGAVRIVDCGHEEIAGLLPACDVYVQPSYVEGLGLAVVEAMACAVPVIVSNTDGLREVVRPEVTGLMVRSGDAAGLADAVLRLAQQQSLRARLARAGLAEVADRFSLTRMVARTEDLYRTVIAASQATTTVDRTDTEWALAGEARR